MSADTSMTGVADLESLRRRRPEAVEAWFLEHADALYTFVFHRVGRDPDLAVDVVQDTFLAALRRIGDYDPARGAMRTWLAYTARNRIKAALKRKGRYRTCSETWDAVDRRLRDAWRELDRRPLPDEILEREETADLVRMALANIPDHYREALERRYCDQRPLREIAREEGLSESAAKSLMHRARLAFRAAFQTIAESLGDPALARKAVP